MDQLGELNQKLSSGLSTSTGELEELSRDLNTIESNVKQSIAEVLKSVQSDSEFRRSMVEAFKNMSSMLKECRENSHSVQSTQNIDHIEAKTQALTQLLSQSQQTYEKKIQQLEIELNQAKEKIAILQEHVKKAVQTSENLESNNLKLTNINSGYQTEINKQMSLFDRLNQMLTTVRTKVSEFLNTSSTTKQNITMYMTDNILAEIRNDVLKGEHFEYINTEQNNSVLVLRVQTDIDKKWINQLATLIFDISIIVDNMTLVNKKSNIGEADKQVINNEEDSDKKNEHNSIQIWVDYKLKITEFLQMWKDKSDNLIRIWITTKQKRHQQNRHQQNRHQ